MNTLRRMPIMSLIAIAFMCITAGTIMLTGCATPNQQTEVASVTPVLDTDEVKIYSGEESFQNRCAVCHGQQAEGTQTGPPLVNRLYEIGHHPNFSFHNAVNKGVTSHHWNFGDMLPIPNVEPVEIDAIICHVRDLQRAEGIAAGEPC